MTRLLIAALIAFACIPAYGGPAPGTPQHCQSPAAANAEIDAAIAIAGGERIVLEGKEAATYIEVLNNTPPQTNLHAEAVVIAISPKRPTLLFFINGGVACYAGMVSDDVHGRAIKAAKGEDI